MLKILTNKILYLILYCLGKAVIFFVPKKKNLWVFGAWQGKAYADNAKYLFKSINQNNPEITAVWITRSAKIKSKIEAYGYKAELLASIAAIKYMSRAEAVFITHSLYSDLNPAFISKSKVVHLFHASYPIKMMGMDFLGFYPKNIIKRLIKSLFYPSIFERPDLAISSSVATEKMISGALGIPRENIINTGFPRIDALVSNNFFEDSDNIETSELLNRVNNTKIIYFVPTFRNNINFSFLDYDFELDKLQHLLAKYDYSIVFRLHPFDLKSRNYLKEIESSRIIIQPHEIDDPYPAMKEASILVTDYSSIYADYLLINRPIIFAAFDLASYLNEERGHYYEYKKTVPGKIVSDWPGLLIALQEVIECGDDFLFAREYLKKIIFEDRCDARSCARIIDAVKNLDNR